MASSLRLLYVDPDPKCSISGSLERSDADFVVETATSGDEAHSHLSEDVDCLVSEYELPGTTGLQLLESVREEFPRLPFILFTGKGSEEVASEAISAGVTDYIQKRPGREQSALLAERVRTAVEEARNLGRQQRRAQAIQTAPEGIAFLDEDLVFVDVNDAYADLFGYTPAEIVGQPWDVVYAPDAGEEARDDVWSTLDEEGCWRGESVFQRADEETFVGTHTVWTTDGGEYVCFAREITERTDHEDELALETRAMDEAPFSITMTDFQAKDNPLSYANERFLGLVGHSREEVLGRNHRFLQGPDTSERAVAEMRRAIAETESTTVELRNYRADDTMFWNRVSIAPIRDDSGTVVNWVGFQEDVTDRKEREQKLELIETIFEHTRECQFIVEVGDREFRLRQANSYYRRTVGLPPDEPVSGQTPTAIFGEDGGPEIIDRYTECVETGETLSYTVELSVPEEGTVYRTILTPVSTDGEVTHIVGTARDITELREQSRMLRHQNKRLEEFASVVSHDLRNPLNVAGGQLELAKAECDSEHLDAIQRAHDRMDALIADLLALAREGDSVTGPEPVDLAAMVEGCWNNVETADATLVTDVDRTVRADESRVKQLFENLIRNAVEHGGEAVTVTVGTLPDGFYVEDDGPGVPRDERDQVFEAGYSAGDSGTGFGLSIVHDIVTAHGWDITVTGSESGGARFEITGTDVDP